MSNRTVPFFEFNYGEEGWFFDITFRNTDGTPWNFTGRSFTMPIIPEGAASSRSSSTVLPVVIAPGTTNRMIAVLSLTLANTLPPGNYTADIVENFTGGPSPRVFQPVLVKHDFPSRRASRAARAYEIIYDAKTGVTIIADQPPPGPMGVQGVQGVQGVPGPAGIDLQASSFGVVADTGAGTNQSAAVQAAINAIKTAKGRLEFPPGDVYVDDGINWDGCDYVTISCPATRFISKSATKPIFYTTGDTTTTLSHFHIDNMRLASSAVRTGGDNPYIKITKTLQFSTLNNVRSDFFGSFMRIDGFLLLTLSNMWAFSMQNSSGVNIPSGAYGIQLGKRLASGASGSGLMMYQVLLRGASSGSTDPANWTSGLILNDVEGISTFAVDVAMFDRNKWVNPQNRCANNFFISSYFDASAMGPSVHYDGTGSKSEFIYAAGWVTNSGNPGVTQSHQSGLPTLAKPGIWVAGSGDYGRFIYSGCRWYQCGAEGVLIETTSAGGFGADYDGCQFTDNGAATPSAHIKFNVASPATAPNIHGGTFEHTTNAYSPGTYAIDYNDKARRYIINKPDTKAFPIRVLGVSGVARTQNGASATSYHGTTTSTTTDQIATFNLKNDDEAVCVRVRSEGKINGVGRGGLTSEFWVTRGTGGASIAAGTASTISGGAGLTSHQMVIEDNTDAVGRVRIQLNFSTATNTTNPVSHEITLVGRSASTLTMI